MSRQASPSTQQRYGVMRVCRVWDVARSTLYAQRAREAVPVEQRPVPRKRGPDGPCSDEQLAGHIRADLAETPFHGEGHRKVWARLRSRHKIRTSKQRVLRVMRQHGLLAPQRAGRPHGPKAHDRTITTDRPDEMWGTDITATVTSENAQTPVFVAVDHCTGECIGIHAAEHATRFEALEPIRQGVREQFGAIGPAVADGLSLRHDHGSQYLSDAFQSEIAFLGITSSPSFVREPEGNGCAERFIRTLKENLLWVRHFVTIEQLRQALLAFKETYNHQWLLQRHGHRSPRQARADMTPLTPQAA